MFRLFFVTQDYQSNVGNADPIRIQNVQIHSITAHCRSQIANKTQNLTIYRVLRLQCAGRFDKKVWIFLISFIAWMSIGKSSFLVNGEWRYFRSCAYMGEPGIVGDERFCLMRTGTFNIFMEYCTCNSKDGCNSSGLVSPQLVTISIATFFSLVLKYLPWSD